MLAHQRVNHCNINPSLWCSSSLPGFRSQCRMPRRRRQSLYFASIVGWNRRVVSKYTGTPADGPFNILQPRLAIQTCWKVILEDSWTPQPPQKRPPPGPTKIPRLWMACKVRSSRSPIPATTGQEIRPKVWGEASWMWSWPRSKMSRHGSILDMAM